MNKHIRSYTSVLLVLLTFCLVISGIELEVDKLNSWAIHLHHIAAILSIIAIILHLFINKSLLVRDIRSLIKSLKQ